MEHFGPSTTTVRKKIANATRGIHQALHEDAVLSRLTAIDVSAAEYFSALKVLSLFYDLVERQRLQQGAFSEFTLADECRMIQKDLEASEDLLVSRTQPIALSFENPHELLGGLYVAHGASFGRSIFKANIEKALPAVSQGFVRQKTNKQLWRVLVQTIETEGQSALHYDRICAGAAMSFDCVAATSRWYQTAA